MVISLIDNAVNIFIPLPLSTGVNLVKNLTGSSLTQVNGGNGSAGFVSVRYLK